MTGLYTENDNNKKKEEEEVKRWVWIITLVTVHREYIFILWRVEEFKQLTEKKACCTMYRSVWKDPNFGRKTIQVDTEHAKSFK